MPRQTKAPSRGRFRLPWLAAVVLTGCVTIEPEVTSTGNEAAADGGADLVVLVVCLAAALVGFYFHKRLEDMEARLMDAIRRYGAGRAQDE